MRAFTAIGPNNVFKKASACIFIRKLLLKLVDVKGRSPPFFEKILNHDCDRYGHSTLNFYRSNFLCARGVRNEKIG